jgi:hypothetical protein
MTAEEDCPWSYSKDTSAPSLLTVIICVALPKKAVDARVHDRIYGTMNVVRYPVLVLVLCFLGLLLAARIGVLFSERLRTAEAGVREDFEVIRAATLTLNGLIIGFTFSIALGRYDQRKNNEQAEANAIGTEYVRTGLLPEVDAAKVRALLLNYLDQRILFYRTRDGQLLSQIHAQTTKLQAELWSAVQVPTVAQPTPISSLVLAGMNDVLNSQGYTQAAWRNRLPFAAWGLMATVAISSNVLVGFGARNPKAESWLLLVLPLVISLAFFLIAEIDTPRARLIRVKPENLLSLSQSLRLQ